jgi:hypothetical protein
MGSAASDQPVTATPDCTSSSGFQVCVHPAFSFYLRAVAADLDPVAAEIAGLPGAPLRAQEVTTVSGGEDVYSGISGNPPVFEFTAGHVGTLFGEFNGYDPVAWREGFQQGLLDAFLTETSQHVGSDPNLLDAAQLVVADVLLTAVGSQPMHGSNRGQSVLKSGPATVADISAAAQRFAALSASARHAWLATHLAALRGGTITLAQIP